MKNGIVVSKKELGFLLKESLGKKILNESNEMEIAESFGKKIYALSRTDTELQFLFNGMNITEKCARNCYSSCSPTISKNVDTFIYAFYNNQPNGWVSVWVNNANDTNKNISLYSKSDSILRLVGGQKYIACNLWKLITCNAYEQYSPKMPQKITNRDEFSGTFINEKGVNVENECRYTNWQFMWLLSKNENSSIDILTNDQIKDIILRQCVLKKIYERSKTSSKEKNDQNSFGKWFNKYGNAYDNSSAEENYNENYEHHSFNILDEVKRTKKSNRKSHKQIKPKNVSSPISNYNQYKDGQQNDFYQNNDNAQRDDINNDYANDVNSQPQQTFTNTGFADIQITENEINSASFVSTNDGEKSLFDLKSTDLPQAIKGFYDDSLQKYSKYFGNYVKNLFIGPESMGFLSSDEDFKELNTGGEYDNTEIPDESSEELEDAIKNARKNFGLDSDFDIGKLIASGLSALGNAFRV